MHLVFAAHADREASKTACRRLMQTAERAGFRCSELTRDRRPFNDGETILVAVGGDGNFIRTAHLACEADLPIFGVNFGHLGFLAEMEYDTLPQALQLLTDGRYSR